METRTLVHTDLKVSRACFGAMTFGSQTDEATAARMVDLCLDRGVNFFDTANSYNGGQSESMLGAILKGRRDRVVLASKLGNKTGFPPDAAPLSRKSVLANIDASLGRLGTDWLDIYYLHLPDYETPIEETLGGDGRGGARGEGALSGDFEFCGVAGGARVLHCGEEGLPGAVCVAADVQPAGARDRAGIRAVLPRSTACRWWCTIRWPAGC